MLHTYGFVRRLFDRGSSAGLTKYLSRGFGGDVALGSSQQFKADHELSNRGQAKQRWIKVSVKLPFWMVLSIARCGMQPHGIRKWRVEDLIVGRGNGLEDGGEVRPFYLRQ